ncbi:hypothetical protein [Vibrio hepatarius]|uniref:hypothetical protein n=1 Tax=Vibrio hepatarius TaxID=171383 RepID=UPI001C0861BE|nr:hypothetical protein [Vibrio hepatarius]MBU2895224.1 hypothetical protein [Vibrio hepatarius]
MTSKAQLACRVCGLIQIEPPWGKDGNSPNYEICDCCGVEFGYEDSSLTGIKNYRKKWLQTGKNWVSKDDMPENWNVDEQLKNIPVQYT